jgi:hypothetical protein
MAEQKPYWFPAKRYGWGWGLPATWQGWVVLVAFGSLLRLGVFLFPPKQDIIAFILYAASITAVLVAICYVKGEPPAWRWGGK